MRLRLASDPVAVALLVPVADATGAVRLMLGKAPVAVAFAVPLAVADGAVRLSAESAPVPVASTPPPEAVSMTSASNHPVG